MENKSNQFYKPQHVQYVLGLEDSKDLYSIGKYLTEHLKIAGGYWSLTSLTALKHILTPEKINSLVTWMKDCQN